MQKLHTKYSKILLIVFVFLCVLTTVVVFYNFKSGATDYEYAKQQISIGDTKITAELADTPNKQQLGLGKRDRLGEYSGMLFPYSEKTIPHFWMKYMLISIDIIWISDSKIIGIEKNIPFPPADTPDPKLPFYSPSTPIDYVLEVNAGFCHKNEIKVGDVVTLL